MRSAFTPARWRREKSKRSQFLFQHDLNPPEDLGAATNLIVGTLHPKGLRPYIVNWDEVGKRFEEILH